MTPEIIKIKKRKVRVHLYTLPFVILDIFSIEGVWKLVHNNLIKNLVIFCDFIAMCFSMVYSSYHYNHYIIINSRIYSIDVLVNMRMKTEIPKVVS